MKVIHYGYWHEDTHVMLIDNHTHVTVIRNLQGPAFPVLRAYGNISLSRQPG